MSKPYFMVICKEEDVYVFASHRRFRTRNDAELYLTNIAVSREPLIVMID